LGESQLVQSPEAGTKPGAALPNPLADAEAALPAAGGMHALIAARDWSDSPLGAPATWPQSLRTTVGLILPAMAQIVLFWGPEFVALYNDAYAPTIGDKHPRALGRPARENWAELWDDLGPLLARVRETGETVSAKDRPFYIERHGYPETVYFDISYSPVPDEQGGVGGVLCIVSETTERVESERRMKDSETRFKAMADSVDQMIWSTLPDGYHDYYNRRWYEYTGVPEGSTDGEAWNGMFHPDDQDHAWSVWRQSLETGEPYHIEYRLRHRSGEYRWVLGRAQPVRDESGAILRWYGTCTDIHGLKAADEARRESEARFRRIADSTPVAMWVTKIDRKRDFVNQAYVDFLGVSREAAVDFDWRTIIHPDDQARVVAESVAGEASLETFELEGRYRGASGDYRWLRSVSQPRFGADGAHIGFIGAAYDITEAKEAEAALRELNQSLEARIEAAILERERAEAALRQAQKMEAVGQLTGGIAHDFNNLLTVIAGNLDLVARRLGADADPRIVRAIGSAAVGADRAATLTQRLLAFSRRQPLAPKAIDPNALVAGMSDLLHRTLGETIAVETRLLAGLSRIEADPHQLESAILNLAVNARDAMPDGGRLAIETSSAHVDAAEAAATAGLDAGTYVVIAVSDSGCGMDADTLGRAIEPFFTTKDVGKGTGLGLSMVYGFVKQSGGHLKIASEPERGTSVQIYLPRFTAESVDEELIEAAAAPRGGGDEIVLVCEDDHDVRAYTVELLGELGYQVLEAQDGAAALAILGDEAQRIDLLFTDVVLPGGMSGAELAKAARARRPGLKLLYTTGYARDAIVHEGRLDPGIELVAKPFAFADLAGRIREVLDRS
jgi:PAS domain S-box-containing protein